MNKSTSYRAVPVSELLPKIKTALANIAAWRQNKWDETVQSTLQDLNQKEARRWRVRLFRSPQRIWTRAEVEEYLKHNGGDYFYLSTHDEIFRWKKHVADETFTKIQDTLEMFEQTDVFNISTDDAYLLSKWLNP